MSRPAIIAIVIGFCATVAAISLLIVVLLWDLIGPIAAVVVAALFAFAAAFVGRLKAERLHATPKSKLTVTVDSTQFELELARVLQQLGHVPTPPRAFKLTREQYEALRGRGPGPAGRKISGPGGAPLGDLAGVRVKIVDNVEESTPHQIRRAQQP